MTANSARLTGVLSPVVTPFDSDLRPDAGRLARHCEWLISNDVGLAVFGTNSEANSLSTKEKMSLLEHLVEAGLPSQRMMPGTGCCALSDSIELTKRAVQLGCGGVLMLPPFYYKGVSDEGLYRNYAAIIDAVGDSRLRIYLYHIPPVAQVPISLALIERLLKDFPGTIAGVKDSSGDWANTNAMLKQFQPEGFDVFAGSESFLLATLRGGGAGCISATANVNPAAIARLADTWNNSDADDQQTALIKTREVFQDYVMIPALKAAIAQYSGDDTWNHLRPPLVELTPEQRKTLAAALKANGFDMPGLHAAAEV
ncbi:MAG TPA: dihydrodipicolinate synthase family protein [Hyphomicrobiaceae bacterium]|nr:dihydrodipicolinate synthase family protein [Hyphomicrobiaceae bacterium]